MAGMSAADFPAHSRAPALERIPVNEPVLEGRELELVADCVRTAWISSAGEHIEEFERLWASYCGVRHGVAVSNGTAALEVAVECLGLEPGDEVVVPSFTIISCALAVVRAGGRPVLVDADPRTWCMDVGQLEEAIGPRTRAIMPVHIYGHPVDMDPVQRLAAEHGLAVIEDAAEAHGAEYLCGRQRDGGEDPEGAPEDFAEAPEGLERDPGEEHAGGRQRSSAGEWKRCGSLGDLSCFSFYANKLVTTGEGGMLLTDDEELATRARGLRDLCFRRDRRFVHTELGHNFRLTNLQAAIGVAQVERIDEIVERKRWMGRAYTERLRDVDGLQLPVEEEWARQVYWMYGIVVDEDTGLDADGLARRLAERGVMTRPFFFGLHEQPVLRGRWRDGTGGGDGSDGDGSDRRDDYTELPPAPGLLPVTERLARQGLYLPSGLALTEEQLDSVCDAVRAVMP